MLFNVKEGSDDLGSHFSGFLATLVAIHKEGQQTVLKHNKLLGLMKRKGLAM